MNNPTDTIIHKVLLTEGIEYACFNRLGELETHSPNFSDFTFERPKQLQGMKFDELFPEFVGYEEILEAVRSGAQPDLRLERSYRADLRGQEGYLTLHVLPYQDGWLCIASDVTEAGQLEQRVTQQRNDLSLLARQLEQTRLRLDDLLRRFLSEQVADAFISNRQPVVLGGMRREVTAMFADLRGFTSWTSTREPEVVIATINNIFDSVLEVLLAHGATVDKFIGDAIFAFFNAPNDQPDHAQRAVQCAREICSLQVGNELRFAIGLNSGPVVAGNIGSLRAMQYTIFGYTVNITKRLEENAKAGQVLMSPRVIELAGKYCTYSRVGEMQFKGASQPMTIYQLKS